MVFGSDDCDSRMTRGGSTYLQNLEYVEQIQINTTMTQMVHIQVIGFIKEKPQTDTFLPGDDVLFVFFVLDAG